MLLTLVAIIAVTVFVLVLVYVRQKPFICSKCEKEFVDFKIKGYEFHNEYYCPHCYFKYDITP